MPRGKGKPTEAIALVFSVGRSEKKYFEDAKRCLSSVIERKLVSKAVDNLCLVVPGSEESYENYENVACPFELQTVTWDMLKFARDLKSTNIPSDWLDGVILAMDILQNSAFFSKKIVLLSDFSSNISPSEFDVVVRQLKEKEFCITVIGPKHFQDLIYGDSEPHSKKFKIASNRSESETESIQLIKQMWTELGEMMEVSTFDQALRHLSRPPVVQKNGKPWNCTMDIGDIQISISAFKKVDPTATKKPITRTQTLFEKDESGPSGSEPKNEFVPNRKETKMICSDGDGGTITLQPSEIIKGLKYGNTLVPFTDADKAALSFKPGPKSLSVLGFTSLDDFNWMHLIGQGSYVVVPRKGDEPAAVALSALIQALIKTRRAAVARKVYSDDRGLSLVLLSPISEEYEIDGEVQYKECLAMNDLPWKECVHTVTLPKFSDEITNQQIKAIDDLIDSMDLMTADKDSLGEPAEAFEISETCEQKNAYYLQCLIQRGLNPDAPLPKESSSLFDDFCWPSPELVENKIENVKKLFPITQIESTKSKFDWKSYHQKLGQEEILMKLPPQIVNYPKPEIKMEDPEGIKEVKVMFQESFFPAPRALIYVLKLHLEPGKPDAVLSCLKECAKDLHDFSASADQKAYNEWIDELKNSAPDVGGLYQFITDMSADSCSPFESEKSAADELDKMDSAGVPFSVRGTLEIERSQLLDDIF